MQITAIHKTQHVLGASLKVLRFVWRHALTFTAFILLFAAFLMYPAIDWPMFCVELVIALCLDKIKMNWKSKGHYSSSSEQMFESAHRNMDSSRFGSSAWATNPAMIGSPANHLYNLGYTNNY